MPIPPSPINLTGKVKVLHLYISPGHNYYGHYGKPPGENEILDRKEIDLVAGRGIQGDRFFDYKPDYSGQATFFAWETFDLLSQKMGVHDKDTSVFRRNIITRGIDLNELIGKEFELQGIHFLGTQEAKPCLWMNQAFGPGAEEALQGFGGLRVKILTSGVLRVEP